MKWPLREDRPSVVTEARLAPDPKTAEERVAEDRQRADRRRAILGLALVVAGFLAIHAVPHVPGLGTWAALAFVLVWAGVTIVRGLRGPRLGGSPIRGLVLVWLAVAVVILVLVSLDSFSGENLILLAAVWGILGALWVADRALARVLRAR